MADTFMNWEPGFNLGIEEIDKQHRKIIDFINSLNQAIINNSTDNAIIKLLDELSDYAVYHFRTEEDIMRKSHFPLLNEHIFQHEKFITKIEDFKSKFDAGDSITFRLLNFLRTWLANHILDSDREYVDIIKSV